MKISAKIVIYTAVYFDIKSCDASNSNNNNAVCRCRTIKTTLKVHNNKIRACIGNCFVLILIAEFKLSDWNGKRHSGVFET